jgi:hypothetical protein
MGARWESESVEIHSDRASYEAMSFRLLLVIVLVLVIAPSAPALTESELDSIGRRVWQNECGGTREGLTSWNSGESFASLGIGHFIWYPRGQHGPFEESFPKLVAFLAAQGTELPGWLKPGAPCPWSNRQEFQAALHEPRLNELRDLLARTVRLQSKFLVQRLETSLPKVLAGAPGADRENVRRQIERLKQSGAGTFALIDYVNFKGDGLLETERYKGQGWGLLQVLQEMRGTGAGAAQEFADAAAKVLTRRVQNSPSGRNEQQWLPGWKGRVRSYGG